MEKENTKIAYLLLVHNCPEQVNLFIDQLLKYGDCDIYIHVDTKAEEIIKDINCNEHVKVFSKYNVRWGSFEIVKAAIFLMEKIKQSEIRYTHMYFGSGQDMLVKNGLYSYLSDNPDSIFLRINKKIDNNDRASARYRICWPKALMIRNDWHIYRFIRIIIQYLCKIGIVLFPNKKEYKINVDFYEGRTWFIAPIDVLNYILKFVEENQDFVIYWENSLASDLMFFQTIIMNSSFKDKVKDELMFVNFGKTFGTMNHPVTITMEDIDKIEQNNFYCARKFDYSNNKDIIDYYMNNVITGYSI